MFINAAHAHTYEEVEAMIVAQTGEKPSSIRCQALWVMAEFETGTKSFRIEKLREY